MHLAVNLFPVTFLVLTLLGWLVLAKYRGQIEQLLALAVAVLAAQWIVALALNTLTAMNLPTYDLYVYRIDGLLGFQPSFALGRLLLPHAGLMHFLDATYQSVLIATTVVIAIAIWRNDSETGWAIRAFALELGLAPLFYLLCPVCGPGFAFRSLFPYVQPSVSLHTVHISAQPNGVPSIHLSTALLILWFARRMPLGRWLAGAYVMLTLLTTLGSGEHYLFDLVIAVPYSVAVAWIASREFSFRFPVRRWASPQTEPR
jgi:hypothetical protein